MQYNPSLTAMTIRCISVAVMFATSAMPLCAAVPDENIVISESDVMYRFIDGKNGVTVANTVNEEYTATRRSEHIQPHIFHDNTIRLDKASGGKPQYRNVNSPSVFHDDSKVCYFDFYLERGKKANPKFRRMFTDPAYFTGIFLLDEYPIRHKTVTVEIPASLPNIQLSDCNFPTEGISRSDIKSDDGTRRVVYTLTNVDPAPDDPCAPSLKSALPYIMVKGYFPDTDSLYRYHSRLLDVDTVIPDLSGLLGRILGDVSDEREKIERLYRYVQRNVRYVAFEEGEAGYRPDAPAEVLRKRYGDCKGMSMLLATLLNRAGIDASAAIVGTRSIPYRIAENPSLAASDHMICIVPRADGQYLFLDPTGEQISMNHIPWNICGKDAMMILPGGGYRMIDIPDNSPCTSADVMTYEYALTPDGLAGRVARRCTEEMAERFAAIFSDVPRQHMNELLARSLVSGSHAVVPDDSVVYDNSVPGTVTLSAPVTNPAAVTVARDEIYLDLNMSDGPFGTRVDTADRRSDYLLLVPAVVERTAVVDIPEGYAVTLPENYAAECPQARLLCEFSWQDGKVKMTKRMEVTSTLIPLADIPAWNRQLSAWNEACNRQVCLKKQ